MEINKAKDSHELKAFDPISYFYYWYINIMHYCHDSTHHVYECNQGTEK